MVNKSGVSCISSCSASGLLGAARVSLSYLEVTILECCSGLGPEDCAATETREARKRSTRCIRLSQNRGISISGRRIHITSRARLTFCVAPFGCPRSPRSRSAGAMLYQIQWSPVEILCARSESQARSFCAVCLQSVLCQSLYSIGH